MNPPTSTHKRWSTNQEKVNKTHQTKEIVKQMEDKNGNLRQSTLDQQTKKKQTSKSTRRIYEDSAQNEWH